MYARRETVVARLQELEENIDPIVRLFEDPEVAEHMKRHVRFSLIHCSCNVNLCLILYAFREDQSLFDYLAQHHDVGYLCCMSVLLCMKSWLCALFQFTPAMVDLVYETAKFKYDCGIYSEAAEYLYFYRIVVSLRLLY